MPFVLGREAFNLSEYGEASNRFHLAYGIALSKWAAIEENLFVWFWVATGMRQDMARAIFYSARNFTARADMLASVTPVSLLAPEEKKFVAALIKKAREFGSFRNTVAHGEPAFDNREGSPTFKQFIHLQGRTHPSLAAASGITNCQLEIASGRFSEIARISTDVLDQMHNRLDPTLPAECLRQLQGLPSEPSYDGPAPTPPKRQRRRQSSPP